ncbi:hypothetical protein D5086_029155 [Populus alba]|uniref:Uncharacterized protein n=1 Tax=Populus alba TaxID=43335 RepID=A0ACC4ASU4_POPAL
MGNTCVGPNLGNKGFLNSVTAAIWRSRPPEDRLPPPKGEDGSNNNGDSNAGLIGGSKKSEGSRKGSTDHPSMPVQNTPPEPVKMFNEAPPPPKVIEHEKSIKPEMRDVGIENSVGSFLLEVRSDKPVHCLLFGHPWVKMEGVALDRPLDPAVLSRLKKFSAMNKLKKIAIRVIAESLSEEEIAGLKEMFKMIDTDSSGHITLEELKTGLEKVGANIKDSELAGLMQAADVDNSGTIDYGEFIAAMLHLNKIVKEDHLYSAFSYFDKDGSGYITQDELQQACEQFGLGDVQLEEIIREVDQDNDGRIDYSEFVAMMQDTGFSQTRSQMT